MILKRCVDAKLEQTFQYFGRFQVFYVWLGCPTLYTSRKSLIEAKMSK